MDTNKPTRLFYKLLAGFIFTDIEYKSKEELEMYSEFICNTIGEVVDSKRLISNMVSHNVITLVHTDKHGMNWYSHNLPKTLAHDYKRDRQGTT
jgi:hypothetical protein